MNTRPVIETPNEHAALSVTFNDDASRFVVGLDSGFCSMALVYNLCIPKTYMLYSIPLEFLPNSNRKRYAIA